MINYCALPKAVLWVSGIGVIAEVTPFPVMKELSTILQFGAFGLCALMMYGVWDILKQHRLERKELVQSLKEKEEENKKLTQQAFKAFNDISAALKDHKCVAGDSRIKVNEQ